MARCNLLLAFLVGTPVLCASKSGSKISFTGSSNKPFQVATKQTCFGKEVEQGDCPDMKPCDTCKPQACVYTDWTDWEDRNDCTGLKYRQRQITTPGNECGTQCEGALEETATAPRDESCQPHQLYCILGSWGSWSSCVAPTEQKYRERVYNFTSKKPAIDVECDSAETKQTMPCSSPKGKVPEDCDFTDWGGWTECSTSCGVGYKTRSRNSGMPENGGKPCNGTLREVALCNTDKGQECTSVPCKWGAWSAWQGCNDASPLSKKRTRRVLREGQYGEACQGATEESECCNYMVKKDCLLSEWTEWEACSPKTGCGVSGQTFRSRRLLHEPVNGGVCDDEPTHETKACELPPCKIEENDCLLQDWEDWGTCTTTCGDGERTRKRAILREAQGDGKGCADALEEVGPCSENGACGVVDCQWSLWGEWSDCTCTCGSGSRTRSRNIARSPRNGGKECEALVKREAEECWRGSCEAPHTCTNGTWHTWSAWSQCSATCGDGFQARHRHYTPPSSCGEVLQGNVTDFQPCNLGACEEPQDCKMQEWSEWTECSKPCFGNSYRFREVKLFGRHGGRDCNESLREARSCNPGEGEAIEEKCLPTKRPSCAVSAWSEWNECPPNGGGQQHRYRHLQTLPCRFEEATHNETLAEVTICPAPETPEKESADCKWSAWGAWSDCTKCGDQKYRTRFMSPANWAGKPCDTAPSMEVAPCNSPCEELYFCVWSEWSAPGRCSATCGSALKIRERHLSMLSEKEASGIPEERVFFKGFDDMICKGIQKEHMDCELTACPDKCQPKDCLFTDWQDWFALGGLGLCQRSRVEKQINNECGKPCNGVLVDTKVCDDPCDHTEECKFSGWSSWSPCFTETGQSSRSRTIIPGHDPKCGGALRQGKPCEGNTTETKPCGSSHAVTDCSFSGWSDWTGCTVTCGGGRTQRHRYIMTAAQDGGKLCSGNMNEVEDCGQEPCSGPVDNADCKFSPWSEWKDECAELGQKMKTRTVLQASSGTGIPCQGELNLTMPCSAPVVNCEMSEWSEWTKCDRKCDGGQRQRDRIIKTFPRGANATPCDDVIAFVEACNTQPCNKELDCELSDWSTWSTCSRECGGGQMNRSRTILHEAAAGAEGCRGALKEVRGCNTLPCDKDTDCVWADWSEWSQCSLSCGGGTHRRHRRIQTFPIGKGQVCTAEKKDEIAPCNEMSCEGCEDGEWGPWSSWTACTATCGQGTSWRSRQVKKMASSCGAEPVGLSTEVKACNKAYCQSESEVDCVLSDWGEWQGCSATCNGVQKRLREIQTTGLGNGAFCQAELGCKPIGGKPPANCTPASLEEFKSCRLKACTEVSTSSQDCKVGEWSEWQCTVTCGRGEAFRSRSVIQQVEGEGKPCDGPDSVLNETAGCKFLEPCADEKTPIDCEYGPWSDWGACTKCAGQRFRNRGIKVHALHGGKACEFGATKDVEACGIRICEAPVFCAWGDWEEWGACDKTCDSGKRLRARHLGLTTKDTLEERAEQNSQLRARMDEEADSHDRQVILAFCAGAVTLVLALGAFRFWQAGSGHRRRPSFDHATE